jgi:hypothetical protein
MPESFVLQCAAVLLEEPPTAKEVQFALSGWGWAPQNPAEGEDGWMTCGPGFTRDRRGQRKVMIDAFNRPWPDDPGAPGESPALADAFGKGLFGVVTQPGALARAKAQSWAWPEGPAAVARHRGVLRLRTMIDLADDAKREPPASYDPLHDLTSLTEVAGALLALRAACAVFFPGGEALRSPAHVKEVLGQKLGLGPPPLELWVNLRAVPLGKDGGVHWMLSDTVGMAQLRTLDQEAIYAEGQEDPAAVAGMLSNGCLHLAAGKPLPAGSTTDDARGRRWKATHHGSLVTPPRQVVRWLPESSARPSEALLAKGKAR